MGNHSCLVYSIPRHQEYIDTGHSSEPILAEAAAVSMYEFNTNPIETLCYLMQNGLPSQEERGERVASLLWTLIFDRAIHRTFRNDYRDQAGYARAAKLSDVLTELIHPDLVHVIPQSPPGTSDGSILEAFEHTYVNYTLRTPNSAGIRA